MFDKLFDALDEILPQETGHGFWTVKSYNAKGQQYVVVHMGESGTREGACSAEIPDTSVFRKSLPPGQHLVCSICANRAIEMLDEADEYIGA